MAQSLNFKPNRILICDRIFDRINRTNIGFESVDQLDDQLTKKRLRERFFFRK